MPRALLHFLWLLLAAVAGQVHVTISGGPNETALAIVSCIIGLQSIYGFVNQGGSLINASSISHYAILLFCVFPALHVAFDLTQYEHKTTIESLILAILLAGLLQWIILSVCPPRKTPSSRRPNFPLSSNTGTLALLLFGFSLALSPDFLGPLQRATGLLAVLFASASVATAPTRGRLAASSALLVAGTLFYAFFIFEGFGRLALGAAAMGIGMLGTLRFSGYWLKAGTLAATAPAIIFLSYQRVAYLEVERGNAISFDEGIGSVTGPFTSAGVIIDRMQSGNIDPSLGTTMFSALTVWIPSALWDDKPPGFGAEMVPITQPQLTNVPGYSDAALLVGEAVWNFGLLGSVIMFVIFSIIARTLDKYYDDSASRLFDGQANISQSFLIVFIVLLASGLLNLVWGGWHTYTARLFIPVGVLLCLWVSFALLAKAAQRGRPTRTNLPTALGHAGRRDDVMRNAGTG